jgi:cullin 1
LLKETQQFYEQECKPYLETHGIIEFMKKIESRLKEEESRIESYLHHSSRNVLITLCEKIMIQNFFLSFEREFSPLLSQNRTEDLQRLYRLLSRVADSLSGISLSFEKYVIESGTSSLASLTSSSNASSSNTAAGNDDGEEDKKDEKVVCLISNI